MLRTPTCPICLKNYAFHENAPVGPRIPLNLSCSHTFCEGCLLEKVTASKEVECPICKEKTFITEEGKVGVQQLLPNIYLLGLLMFNKRLGRISSHPNSPINKLKGIPLALNKVNLEQESIEAEDSEDEDDQEILCEVCNKEKATCQCKNCDYTKFCWACFREAHRPKWLSKHQPLPLDATKEEPKFCSVHEGRPLEFYDKNLGELVCALCSISGKSKGHEVVEKDAMVTEESPALPSEFHDQMLKAKDQLAVLEYSQKVLQHAMPEVTMDANQIIHDVQLHFMALHALLQKRELDILESALRNFAESSSLDDLFQELSRSHKTLLAAIKDGEKLLKDKKSTAEKQEEVSTKLNILKDSLCFAERNTEVQSRMSFTMTEEHVKMFEDIGSIDIKSARAVTLKTMEETSEEEINRAKSETESGVSFSVTNLKMPEMVKPKKIDVSAFTLPESKLIHAMRASYERVFITDIRSPTDFSVQRSSDMERLQNMMRSVDSFCRKSDKNEDLVFTVKKGDLVLAQFTKDNQWYRGMVLTEKPSNSQALIPTWENGLCVEVYYVDYGNSEWLALPRLRRMKPQFLDVPELAVPCSLCDIVPPRNQEKWPQSSIDAFGSLVGQGALLMNIRYRHEGRLFVDLRGPDDEERTPGDERPISTRDALVFLEVACFYSEYSIPDNDIKKPTRVYKDMIPPEPKEMLDVIVTYVNSPDSIFVQKLDNISELIDKDLKKLYSSKNKDIWRISYPYRNLVCAARYSEDKKWYRALVKSVNENRTVNVLYVDFGNVETVGFSFIKKLPDTWLNIAKQAIEVKLKDVGLPEGQTDWSKQTITFLNEKILNKPIVMIVEGQEEDGVIATILCDTSTDRDVYIAPLLVQEGLARSTGPSSDLESLKDMFSKELVSEDVVDSNVVVETITVRTYQYTRVPPGEYLELLGVYVDGEGNIYAHRVKDSSLLGTIMEDLNAEEGKKSSDLPIPTSTDMLSNSQPCIARFSEDGLWYRAVILGIIDDKSVKIEFVDFGNREVADINEIRISVPSLDIPRQAIKIELNDVAPVAEDGSWSNDVIGFLSEVTINQPISATCKEVPVGSNVIVAKVTVRDGNDLSQLLVKHGLALMSAEGSHEHPMEEASDDLRFGNYVLPNVGVEFDVMVTQVDKENLVFVQRLPQVDGQDRCAQGYDDTLEDADQQIAQLMETSQRINEPGFFTDDSKLELNQIVQGMPCCVQDKGDSVWYRAKVKRLPNAEEKIAILYVDYGLSDLVDITYLRTMPPDIAQLPCQGICCRLSGVRLQPTSNPDDKRKMLINAMRDLFDLVANKRLVAVILEHGAIPSISLFERAKIADSETGETEDISLEKRLADLGHVTYDPPISNTIVDENDPGAGAGINAMENSGSRAPTARRLSTKMMELPTSADPQIGE